MIAKTSSRAPKFSVVLAFLMAARCWGAQNYSLTDLGALSDLAGRTDSKPYAINALGVVAEANVTGGSYQALVYTNSWQDLGTLGGNESLASGINDSGRVVGYSFTGGGATNAFLWTPGGNDGVPGNPQMKSLGTLGGGVSQAYAINNSGQIAGYSDTAVQPPQQHAFVYTAGSMRDISQGLASLPNSYGYGINTSGHVAGTAYDANYTAPHAFFYDGSTSRDLGVFGGLGSSALAINNLDTIVGYLTTTSSIDHAFFYSGGSSTDMGTLGGNYSYALAVNNDNAIVGGSFVDSKDSVYHAFIWSGGVMTDLNGHLGASGTGWTLIEARAINDNGQITGIGSVGGSSHAFLLTPASTPPPPQASQITSIQTVGSDVVIHFTTSASGTYTLQMNGTLSGNGWTDLNPSLLGTGGVLSVTNSGGATFSARFYRVRASVP